LPAVRMGKFVRVRGSDLLTFMGGRGGASENEMLDRISRVERDIIHTRCELADIKRERAEVEETTQ